MRSNFFLVIIIIFMIVTSMTLCMGTEEDKKIRKGIDILSVSEGNETDGGDNGNDGNNGGPTGTVKLVFWHTFQYAKEVELIKKTVKDFERENPNIKVDVQQQTYSDAINKFRTAAIGGVAPDVMRVPNDRLGELAVLGLIAPLDQYISVTTLDSYVPMAMDAMKYKGTRYALPASYDSIALVYNKAMLLQKKYDEPPADLDELVTMAKALTYGDKYGFVMPITDAYWWFMFQYGFGGTIFTGDGTPSIYSPASVDATDYIFELEEKHGVMPKGGADKNLMMSLFTEQKAAMIATGPWNIEDIKAADIDYGIASFPKNPANNRSCAPLVGIKGYVVSKDSPHKLESYRLIQYLTSHKVTKDFALVSDTLPSVKSVYGEEAIINNEVIQGFLAQAELGQPAPSLPEMSEVWGPLTDALQLIYSGDKTADNALADAQKEIESAIEE